MADIVKLSNIKKRKRLSTPDYVAEKIDASDIPSKHAIDFTCPTCYNHTKFTFDRMVFKNLQFFCSKCGTGWKVSNPLYISKNSDTKPK